MSTSYRYTNQPHYSTQKTQLSPYDKRYLKSYLDNLSDSNRQYQDPNKTPSQSMIVEDNLDNFIKRIDHER